MEGLFRGFLDDSTMSPSPRKRLLSHTGANDLFRMVLMSNGGEEMKIVNLCSCGSCCPVVKVADDHIEIGEEGNLCVLTTEEWETLKSKIIDREM